MDKRLMNVREVSVYLAMPVATVYAYVGRGKFPKDCIRRIGRSLKFDRMTVDLWVSGETSNNPEVSSLPSRKETGPISGPAPQGAA